MKIRSLALLGVFAVVACSEQSANDLTAPQYAGVGNAHFVTDLGATGCSMTDWVVTCPFKAAGLANGATVTVSGSAAVVVTYDCMNPDGRLPPGHQNKTGGASLTLSVTKGNKDGNASGVLTFDLTGDAATCPGDNWTVLNSQVTSATWQISGNGYNGRTTFSLGSLGGNL